MSRLPIAFDEPLWLLLLALLPVLWWVGRQSLAGLGATRAGVALAVRSLVFVGIVLALAELQWVRTSDRVSVFYLIDRSLSIPPHEVDRAIEFVNASIALRDQARGDRAGVIVFGGEPAVEAPLDEHAHRASARLEAAVDPAHTNLAAALRLAQASFPSDGSKRVVILSDGNQNYGDVLAQARRVTAAAIGIDVVPLTYSAGGDVIVEKLAAPRAPRQSEAFELRVVLDNQSAGKPAPVSGRLRIERRGGDTSQTLLDEPLQLEPGKRVFTLNQRIDEPDFYTYEARFVPDDAAQDFRPENNRATTFAQVRGQGSVLLIEDGASPGEFALLAERLRADGLHVTVRPSQQAFSNLAELQRYDAVILANVPRTSILDDDSTSEFTDEQIDLLVRNTQQLGCGLIMLGGPNSFGAGGWTNTALEKAMPVDFQIKNAKVTPVGALVLVIDRSGSMTGEKIEMAKASALATARQMGDRDLMGVVGFDGSADWVVPLMPMKANRAAVNRIQRIGAGGGTNMYPGMELAFEALRRSNASAKHIIVLTDGNSEGGGFLQLAEKIRKSRITLSSVAVGEDSARTLLQQLANIGGGKYYFVKTPRAIPRIFMNEARRIARPLVFESAQGVVPRVAASHEMLRGISEPLPPLTGFVMTTAKDSPLVEIPLVSPTPGPNSPLLAGWSYGVGKAVALTTDGGARWAHSWSEWEGYDRLYSQIVRWALRATDEADRFVISTTTVDGKTQVVATATDDDGDETGLDLFGWVVTPNRHSQQVVLRKTAPRRFVGEFVSTEPGSYFVSIAPGGRRAPMRFGVDVLYSAEFKDRETNEPLLAALAAMPPRGGLPGRQFSLVATAGKGPTAPAGEVFRATLMPSASSQGTWHLVVLAASCLFLVDVLVRKVHFNLAGAPVLLARVKERVIGRPAAVESQPTFDRLTARKQEVATAIEARAAAVRFASQDELQPAASLDEMTSTSARPATETFMARPLAAEAEGPSYTERLLKVKQQERAKRGG